MPKKPPRRPRIEEEVPALRQAALVTYAQTGSINAVARECGLSWFGARAVLTRSPGAFQDAKRAAGNAALESSALYGMVASKKATKLTPMQAVIASKIAAQQAIELTSQPGSGAAQVTVNVLANVVSTLRELEQPATPQVTPPQPSLPTTCSDSTPAAVVSIKKE